MLISLQIDQLNEEKNHPPQTKNLRFWKLTAIKKKKNTKYNRYGSIVKKIDSAWLSLIQSQHLRALCKVEYILKTQSNSFCEFFVFHHLLQTAGIPLFITLMSLR